jgi:uncharacterized membrane protein (DUF4010 family)
MQLDDARILGFAAALGIGLLIGVERERRKGTGPHRAPAGVRTFALTALLGAVAASVGALPGLLLVGAFLAVLIALGFRRAAPDDPGLTTEVALFLTLLLGALATESAGLASALGVLVAMLLAMRTRLHRFATTVLSADELHDALLLAAAALVVLPLLPDRGLGPYGAVNLHTLWRLVVLILAIGMLGHVGTRVLGPRYGLPLAGLAAGFVSSVATISAMGQRASRDPRLLTPAVAGGALSSVATVVQMVVVLLVVYPPAVLAMAGPLAAAGAVAVLYGAWFTFQARRMPRTDVQVGHAFHPGTAIALAASLGVVMAGVPALREWLGPRGVWAGALLAGFADTHAVAVSLAALARTGTLRIDETVVPILLGFSSNSVMKILAARVSGSRAFVLRLAPGVVLIAAAAWVGLVVGRPYGAGVQRPGATAGIERPIHSSATSATTGYGSADVGKRADVHPDAAPTMTRTPATTRRVRPPRAIGTAARSASAGIAGARYRSWKPPPSPRTPSATKPPTVVAAQTAGTSAARRHAGRPSTPIASA